MHGYIEKNETRYSSENIDAIYEWAIGRVEAVDKEALNILADEVKVQGLGEDAFTALKERIEKPKYSYDIRHPLCSPADFSISYWAKPEEDRFVRERTYSSRGYYGRSKKQTSNNLVLVSLPRLMERLSPVEQLAFVDQSTLPRKMVEEIAQFLRSVARVSMGFASRWKNIAGPSYEAKGTPYENFNSDKFYKRLCQEIASDCEAQGFTIRVNKRIEDPPSRVPRTKEQRIANLRELYNGGEAYRGYGVAEGQTEMRGSSRTPAGLWHGKFGEAEDYYVREWTRRDAYRERLEAEGASFLRNETWADYLRRKADEREREQKRKEEYRKTLNGGAS